MRALKVISYLVTLSLLFAVCATAVAEENQTSFKVVVHSSNPITTLSKAQVSKLFMKKVTKWEDGKKVLPVDQTEIRDVREDFSMKIYGKRVSAIKSFWQQMIFSGRAVPPPEKTSDIEVMKFVATNINAIGYVSVDVEIKSALKEIEVIY